MDGELFKLLNLSDFLKDSSFLNPVKEHYPDYLLQLLERTLDYMAQGEMEKAKELIIVFNSNFKDFQIGILIEIALDIQNVDSEQTIAYLNTIPESSRNKESIGFFYHIVKAFLYFSMWDIDLARQACDEAIKIDPAFGPTYYLRGTCFALRGLHFYAIENYKRALKDNFKTNEITAQLAYSYLREGRIRKSFRLHKRIADKFPENDKVQYNTGICFMRFKKYSKAVWYFDRAIALNLENAGYRLTRSRVLMRLKRYEEAQLDLVFAFESGLQIAKEILQINTEVLQHKINSRKAERKVLEILRNNYRNG